MKNVLCGLKPICAKAKAKIRERKRKKENSHISTRKTESKMVGDKLAK